MNEFILSINAETFRKTNQRWNELMLNDPWSVGYVTRLIETKLFDSKEDWEAFYYESGNERAQLISGNVFEKFLNDETVPIKHKDKLGKLSTDKKGFNYDYGRTISDLYEKGLILYSSLHDEIPELTPCDAIECVRFRVICETWNGIVLREKKTLTGISSLFPSIVFRKTDGSFDHKYGVDYEGFHNEKLIMGIQIKPQSYIQSNASYLEKARYANKLKNSQYHSEFSVPVYTIASTTNGNICNNEVVVEMSQHIYGL